MTDAMVDGLYSIDILRLAARAGRRSPTAVGMATGSSPWARGSATRSSALCGSHVAATIAVTQDGALADLALTPRACALGQAASAVLEAAGVGQRAPEIAETAAALSAMLGGAEPAFDARWDDLRVLMPARALPARHEAILLPFHAVLDAMTLASSAEGAGLGRDEREAPSAEGWRQR